MPTLTSNSWDAEASRHRPMASSCWAMDRPKVEVADIFGREGKAYRRNLVLSRRPSRKATPIPDDSSRARDCQPFHSVVGPLARAGAGHFHTAP